MAGGIDIPDGSDWYVANWGFMGVLELAVAKLASEQDIWCLRIAMACHGLSLVPEFVPYHQAIRLAKVIASAAAELEADVRSGHRPPDRSMFADAFHDLQVLMSKLQSLSCQQYERVELGDA